MDEKDADRAILVFIVGVYVHQTTQASFEAAKGAAAHAAVVGVVSSLSDPRGVASKPS